MTLPPLRDVEAEINIYQYWHVIKKRKYLLTAIIITGLIGAILYCKLTKPLYRADSTLMILGDASSNFGSLLSQGGLGGIIGATDTASQKLLSALNSRTLSERVVKKLEPYAYLFPELWDFPENHWKEGIEVPNVHQSAAVLKFHLTTKEDKGKALIKLSYEAYEPSMAELIIGAYIVELNKYLMENNLTTAKRNRVFLERRIESMKAHLLNIGRELSQFYTTNRVPTADSSINVDVSERYDTDTLNDINANDQLALLETKTKALEEKVKQSKIVKNVPQQVYLQYLSGYYKMLESTLTLLTSQYEVAKITEAKEDLSFQIIDLPLRPRSPSWPQPKLIITAALIMSSFLALFVVFLLEYLHTSKKRWVENCGAVPEG